MIIIKEILNKLSYIKNSGETVQERHRAHALLLLNKGKLEKLRLNYKIKHFAIKEKIYIEALKVAYQKVEELQVA